VLANASKPPAWITPPKPKHRRLAAVNLLIIDDYALQPLDETATSDFYELTVARHRKNATIVTSNRTPTNGSPS